MEAKLLIKQYEGLRLKAYPDPGTNGVPWTIGWGHTHNVKRGDVCTTEQAEIWLDEDMSYSYSAIDKYVEVPITVPQREALCSFIFNIGAGAFKKSLLLKKLNQKDYIGAGLQFDRWVYGGGSILPGLVKRRKQEKALFLSGTNIPEPAFPQETQMAPFAAAILTQAIPALIGKLPEIAAIFKNPDVRERNVEAVAKVGEIIVQATGASNVQEAVEKIEADPEAAQAANEALRLNRAELVDLIERLEKIEDTRVASAREFNSHEKPIFGNWKFIHLLSIMFVILGGAASWYVLGTSVNATERGMALQALILTGFGGVAAYWLGSSRGSQLKDEVRNNVQ